MARALQRAWLRRGALACLLWPFSLLFGALAALRRAVYRSGILKTERMPVPVIVVGNVVAGGAGKTPAVMAMVAHMRSRGVKVGVVSRGYGRRTGDCREVQPGSDPREVGDEPLLIAHSCAVPVFVAARRADAARALLQAWPQTELIICDDGLQHYGLARDIEICVFDDRGVGNGWLLPAGPLRESWPRPVDLVLRSEHARGIDGHTVRRELAASAVRADGAALPLEELRGAPLIAVAAIARHEQFFDMLRARGVALDRTLALPDHAGFDDVMPTLEPDATLICTQKDAVKLWRLRPDAWAVPLVLGIDGGFWRELDATLAKLSSAHGPQTS